MSSATCWATGDHGTADDHGRRRQGRSADDAGRPLADPPVHPRRAEHAWRRSAPCSRAMCAMHCAPVARTRRCPRCARAAAGDGGRDGHVLPRHGRRDVRPRRHAVARGRHHAGRSGDLCPRGLQRAALHRLHQPDQHGEQHRRARPVPGTADRQRDRRRSHHHQEPAARALCRENYKNVAQVGRLVLAGDAEHRRPATCSGADAQHDRVVGVPVDARRTSGEDRALPRTRRRRRR
ncbi:Uncharacterised protein [Pseudomonas aeruginosa]|nr:Uncharacterised protein [Pseudomonas aeruginosa]